MPTMHKLIVSPFLGEYLVLRPGSPGGLKISEGKYRELTEATSSPAWFTDSVSTSWAYDISASPLAKTVLIRAVRRRRVH
jgi:hypothetical protein